MKTSITITGEYYGRSGEVVWPADFSTPVEGQSVQLRDGTTVYVRTVVYYPQGDEDHSEPFVYVVLGPRRPVGEPDDLNRQFAGPSGAAHPWAHIYDEADPADSDIVIVRRADLSALANVVAVAIAREQVSRNDTAVHEAYARAKEALGARPTP